MIVQYKERCTHWLDSGGVLEGKRENGKGTVEYYVFLLSSRSGLVTRQTFVRENALVRWAGS